MPSSPQTVATQVVFDYLLDSQGKPLVGHQVQVTLDYSFASNQNPVVFILPVVATTVSDANGYWQLSLVPNPNITPAGTVYSVEVIGQLQYQISVPATAGPFQTSSILVNQPSVLSPATTNLTGPLTVTGNETVTGNLIVQGTTTLGVETAGTTTLAATQVQGDLTIASAFRLLFLAAVSKIVPGATSFSVRDNADANDNLLVTNAGAVTVRNGLTVSAGGAAVTGALSATQEVSGLDFKPSGLTGAVAASRFVGATAGGSPSTGTFAVGDYVVDQNGITWVCTVAGSPGTWRRDDGWFGAGVALVGTPTINSRFLHQGGSTVGTTDGASRLATTFPNAYPTGVLVIVAMIGDQLSAQTCQVVQNTVSTTGFSIVLFNTTNNTGLTSTLTRINWFAVGF